MYIIKAASLVPAGGSRNTTLENAEFGGHSLLSAQGTTGSSASALESMKSSVGKTIAKIAR
jgi:hypothetical protein